MKNPRVLCNTWQLAHKTLGRGPVLVDVLTAHIFTT